MSRYSGCNRQPEKQFLIPKKVSISSSTSSCKKKKERNRSSSGEKTKSGSSISSGLSSFSKASPPLSPKIILDYIHESFNKEISKGLNLDKFSSKSLGMEKQSFSIIINFTLLEKEKQNHNKDDEISTTDAHEEKIVILHELSSSNKKENANASANAFSRATKRAKACHNMEEERKDASATALFHFKNNNKTLEEEDVAMCYSSFKISLIPNQDPNSIYFGKYVYPVDYSSSTTTSVKCQSSSVHNCLTMKYKNLKTFLLISMKRLDPKVALLSGKLSVSGNMKCLYFFKILERIQKQTPSSLAERQAQEEWYQSALTYLEEDPSFGQVVDTGRGVNINLNATNLKAKKSSSSFFWNYVIPNEKKAEANRIVDAQHPDFAVLPEANFTFDKMSKPKPTTGSFCFSRSNPVVEERDETKDEDKMDSVYSNNSLKANDEVIHEQIQEVNRAKWDVDLSVTQCRLCATPFSLLRRKHHCRYCGRIICHPCSNQYLNYSRCCYECMSRYSIGFRKTSGKLYDKPQSEAEDESKCDVYLLPPGKRKTVTKNELQSEMSSVNGLKMYQNDDNNKKKKSIANHFSSQASESIPNSNMILLSEIKRLKSKLDSMERKNLKSTAISLLNISIILTLIFRGIMLVGLCWFGFRIADYLCTWKFFINENEGGGNITSFDFLHSHSFKYINQLVEGIPFEFPFFYWSLSLVRLMKYFFVVMNLKIFLQRNYFRQFLAFTSMLTITIYYLLIFSTSKTKTKATSEKMMRNFDVINAIFIKLNLFELKGMYLKLGQYLSSRADLFDQCYIDELSAVQDVVSATPCTCTIKQGIVNQIKTALFPKTVKEKKASIRKGNSVDHKLFPSMKNNDTNLETFFQTFEETAIASASIAQVHSAQMYTRWIPNSLNFKATASAVTDAGTSEGESHKRDVKDLQRPVPKTIKVAVKLQHPDIKYTLRSDLSNMRRMASLLALLLPDFNMVPLFDEWAKELCHELDFQREYKNLLAAYKTMKSSTIDVIIPKPILATESILIMEYIDGFKITDEEKLRLNQVDETQLMTNVCQAYGYMMYISGILHGDPHPGNILVNISQNPFKARPVILDWGLSKHMSKDVRLGNSLVVHSVNTFDAAGMNDGISRCGVDTKKMDVFGDIDTIRFMMRETQPMQEAQNANKMFIDGMVTKTKKQFADGNAPSNPLQAMVGELLFFARVTDLLQGLCSKLNVRVNYLEIMGVYAKTALIDESKVSQAQVERSVEGEEKKKGKSLISVSVPESLSISLNETIPLNHQYQKNYGEAFAVKSKKKRIRNLQKRVEHLLQSVISKNQIHGCQIVAYYKTQCIVNSVSGKFGEINPRSMKENTLLCGYSMSNFLLTLLVYQLVERNFIPSLETPIWRIGNWRAFAQNGKENITVDDVLRHRAGLHYFLPDKLNFSTLTSGDKSDIISDLEKASVRKSRSESKSYRCSFHYFSFGWILSELIERSTGKSLSECFQEFITIPLGIQEEMIFGGGARDYPNGSCKKTKLKGTTRGITSLKKKSIESADISVSRLFGSNSTKEYTLDNEDNSIFADTVYNMKAMIKYQKEMKVDLKELGPLLLLDGPQEIQEDEMEETETVDVTKFLASLSAKAFLLDPRIMNSYYMRTNGFLPSLNSFFSANAFAKILLNLSGQTEGYKLLSPASIERMQSDPQSESPTITKLANRTENILIAGGCQLFEAVESPSSFPSSSAYGNENCNSVKHQLRGFGCASQGGQLAFQDPSLKFTIVVLTNTIPVTTISNDYKKEINLGKEILSIFDQEINKKHPSSSESVEYNLW